MSVGMLTFWA